MISISEKMTIALSCTLMVLAAIYASLFSQPLVLIIPVAVASLFFLLQYPSLLFYTLIASIPWSVEYSISNSLATDFPDEPLMLLAGLVTISFLLQKKRFSHRHLFLLIVLFQFIWSAATISTSTVTLLSVKYQLAKSWYLLSFLFLPIFIWRDEKQVKITGIILFVSMMLLVVASLFRHALLGFRFADVNDALLPFFRNHVIYSSLLVFMIPVNIIMLQVTTNKLRKRLLFVCLLILLLALYFSYARGAWLALMLGLTGYWLIKKRILLLTFIIITCVCFLAFFYLSANDRYLKYAPDYQTTIFHENFDEHFQATYKLKDVSTAERFHRWVAGIRMIRENWMTGWGPSTFYSNYKSYTVPAYKTWVSKNEERSTVHNYFLLICIEQGMIGLALFLLLIAAIFYYAQKIYHQTSNLFWKLSAAAIAVITIMQCTVNFFSDLIETDKVGSIFYLCIAFLIVADKKTMKHVNMTKETR